MELNLYIFFSLNQLLANERNVKKMSFFGIDNFTVYLIFFFVLQFRFFYNFMNKKILLGLLLLGYYF